MGEKISEKSLGGMVPAEVVDSFSAQCDERGFKNKRALNAAIRFWLQVPETLQSRLIKQSIEVNEIAKIANGLAGPEPAIVRTPREALRAMIAQIKEMVEVEQQQPGTIYHVLSAEDQKVLDDLRRLHAPKDIPSKKKTKAG